MTLAWVQQTPATSPTNRYGGKMAYFPGLGTILVGGTVDGTNALHDGPTDTGSGLRKCATWLWNGTTWAMLTPVTDAIAGFGGALIYDSTRTTLVWIPAFDGSFLNEYSEFDGTTWTNYTSSPFPVNGVWACGAYDKHRGVSVYWSGTSSGTLELNTSTHTWTAITTAAVPPTIGSVYGFGMAFDEVRNLIVMFDSDNQNTHSETWTYDGTNWTHASPVHSPAPVGGRFPCMVWDPTENYCLLQRGSDTWSWDGTDWTDLSPSTQVPGAGGDQTNASMAYDPVNYETVYFFGDDNGNPSTHNQTWLLADPLPPIILNASNGSFVETGTAATFERTRELVASSGTFVLTGTPVSVLLVSITVSPSSATIVDGNTVSLTATGHYQDHTTANITSSATWTTADGTIATVVLGVVTGVGVGGPVLITATQSAISGASSITVLSTYVSLVIAVSSGFLYVKQQRQFSAIGINGSGRQDDLTLTSTWSSSDPSIATVSATGVVTGVSIGHATITATHGSLSASSIAVVELPVANTPIENLAVVIPTAINVVLMASENITENLRVQQAASLTLPSMYKRAYMIAYETDEIVVVKG